MNVVDSSGWIEYLEDAPNAEFFRPVIEDAARLIVPAICMVEVFRWVLRESRKAQAVRAASLMHAGRVVDLDGFLAFLAAWAGLRHRLPLADSVIFATARAHGATLWTQDADFENLPGVRFQRRR